MSSGRLCGFKPITFCRKLTRLQVARGLALKKLIKGKHDFRRASTSKNNVEKKKSKKIKSTASQTPSVAEASPKSFKSPKQATASGSAVSPLSVQKKPNTPRHNDFEGSSPKCTANFILMVELRKNIFSFRDMIDLPSLDGSLSVTEIITHTMKDLQKLSPEIVTINQSFDMEGAEMDKMLIFFYEDLRAIGDSWIMDSDWIYRSKYRNSGVGKNKSDRLVEHVLAALDGLIKMTKERFGMMDLDSDGRKSFKGVPSEARRSFRRSVSYSESNNSFFPSPLTPRSVIPGTMMSSSSSTSPSLWNLRAQALDKLSPVDLKQLAMRILSRRDSDSLQDLDLKNIIEEEQEESEKLGEDDEDNDSSVSETEDHSKSSETEHETEGEHHIESSGTEHVVTDGEHHKEGSETEHEDHSEPTTSETDSTESFQEAISVTKLAPPSPPPPPPSPSPSFLNKKATPLSQPPPSSPQPGRKTLSPPPPPPPSRRHDSGGNSPTTPAPPAPPGSGRTLRVLGKLSNIDEMKMVLDN
uniref:Uncharacterized protein n=1 Tax=Brassica oleracea var. oleracea TaxID=109376 RepID=A0A0D3E837_BRAOL